MKKVIKFIKSPMKLLCEKAVYKINQVNMLQHINGFLLK